MSMSSTQRTGIALIILTVLLVCVGFAPWGYIHANRMGGSPGHIGIPATAWSGSVTIIGLTLPNWLTTLAALLIVALYWLRALDVFNVPRTVLVIFSLYGIAHCLLVIAILALAGGGTLGFGVIASLGLFIGMLVTLIKSRKTATPPPVA